ncbi:MAG: glycosyltransferase N-terminal domain-containing protein [Gammaproteobacteria bacterium]|nr:glycosyltransferase N-terminal domain-containing protein [Gammaproteobacteria bacterium]
MTIYHLLIVILSPLIFAHLLWKSIRLKQPRFLLQRLGLKLQHIPQNCLWFHCASVGEVNTILPLLHELHQRHPKQPFLITTNTTTGAEIVARQNLPWLHHAFLPMDWRLTTLSFIRRLKPIALLLVETELWPNLIVLCSDNGIAVNIINGRLSIKTTGANRWVRSVYQQVLSHVNHIYVRSQTDQDNYLRLGASREQVSILGNLKFIPPASVNAPSQTITRRDYVLVASSHHDEEYQIANVWSRLKRDELLVIAPRHPERREHIIKQLKQIAGIDANSLALRSHNNPVTEQTRIYLLDTVGELMQWYALAKLIIMAGSFTHRGGHNLLEPAHFGKTIIFGPHMESFVDESQLLLAHNAVVQVQTFEELGDVINELLDNENARLQLEANVKQTLQPFARIVHDYADVIELQL